MKAGLGLIGLLIALAIGWTVYTSQIRQISAEKPLIQQADLIAVRSSLISLGQAEKMYFAANGSYATLQQLKSSGVMSSTPSGIAGYRFDAKTEGSLHFRITASPTDSSRSDLPILSIDETMQVQ
jgi:Tfp pilus assembly protein PilE